MGRALLEGFQSGFSMMERHNARIGREERQEKLDKINESSYQDSQTRLADMDQQKSEQYQDTVDYRNKTADNTAKYRQQTTEATAKYREQQNTKAAEHRQWQVNQAEEQKQWGLIAPQMQNIHQEYFKTGKLPEQAAKFFEENPQYNDYNPDSYKNPEYRKAVKMLRNKTHEIFKSKKLHEFKNPEYIKLFDQAFQSKIKQGIGEVDLVRNATVVDKEVAQLIPTRNGKVSIGLKVTYQDNNGKTYTEIQPMTKGRTSDQEDPVNELELKELLSTIEVRSNMADMAENGEHYLNRSGNTLKAMGFGGAKDKKAYRKEVNAIKKELRKAESEANEKMLEGDERTKFLKPFNDALTEIDNAYGVKSEKAPEPTASTANYKSTVEGQDVNGVVAKFMSANKGMTEQQAIAAATNQGYLTNDE